LRMTREFAPIPLRNGGGAIVNLLWVVSWYVSLFNFNCIYRALKHAVLASRRPWGATQGTDYSCSRPVSSTPTKQINYPQYEISKGL
jgi:hypothetical protein